MKARTELCLTVATGIAFLINGCATHSVVSRNETAGHRLALLFQLNNQMDSRPHMPETLTDLEKQLRIQGIEDPLPKCECPDGKLRDFVYIPGFVFSDGRDWAFLFSPSEMDSDAAIVVYLDTTTKIMTPGEASKEKAKSRAFTEKRPLPGRGN
jgi:hypothetical protein